MSDRDFGIAEPMNIGLGPGLDLDSFAVVAAAVVDRIGSDNRNFVAVVDASSAAGMIAAERQRSGVSHFGIGHLTTERYVDSSSGSPVNMM